MKEITLNFNKTKLFRGDSIDIDCTVNFNLTGYKIRAEISDRGSAAIKRANTAAGGGDTQVKVNTATASESTFTIYILKDTTDLFDLNSWLEIEVEDANGKVYTLYSEVLKFNVEKITWTSV